MRNFWMRRWCTCSLGFFPPIPIGVVNCFRITIYEFEFKMRWLLKSQPKLLKCSAIQYCHIYIHSLQRMKLKEQISLSAVLSLCAGVCVSVMQYQDGDATLEQTTVEVLEQLGNRDDLI